VLAPLKTLMVPRALAALLECPPGFNARGTPPARSGTDGGTPPTKTPLLPAPGGHECAPPG